MRLTAHTPKEVHKFIHCVGHGQLLAVTAAHSEFGHISETLPCTLSADQACPIHKICAEPLVQNIEG